MASERTRYIKDAQKFVREFAKKNGWIDEPNIDKFDHLHEELIEMSHLLRYKNLAERKATLAREKEKFEDGVGDLFFALCRLANQLGVDLEASFNIVKDEIQERYKEGAEGSHR